ncbi:MAG: hypothetical protein LBK82_12655 [Planctomycetaceae bacterium]|nr:hypothetical protein [Planctomycetaceae bacterium]
MTKKINFTNIVKYFAVTMFLFSVAFAQENILPAAENKNNTPKKETQKSEFDGMSKTQLKKALKTHAKTLLENFELSEKYHEKNDKYDKKLNLELANSYCNVGEIFAKLNDPGMAWHFYLEAYLTYEDILGKKHADTKKAFEKTRTYYKKSEKEEYESFDEIVKNDGLYEIGVRHFVGETLQFYREELEKFIQGKRTNVIDHYFNKSRPRISIFRRR